MNKVIISGRTTTDIELKTTTSGKSVCNFSLAVNEGWGNKQKASFFRCVAWEKRAESASKYVSKGDMIIVTGRLQTRIYEKGGERRETIEILADEIEFLPKAKKEDDTAATYVPESYAEAPKLEPISTDEELPF